MKVMADFRSHGVDISVEQWSLLAELLTRGTMIQSALAEGTGRDADSVFRLLSSTESEG